MHSALSLENPLLELSLEHIFSMTDYWWTYHLEKWMKAEDPIVSDLARRLYLRKLFKTIRLPSHESESTAVLEQARDLAKKEFNYDPDYYVLRIGNVEESKNDYEPPPLVEMKGQKPVDSGLLYPQKSSK